ncbi:glycosyltransferase [Pseudodonghicola flavimaris]|uniref:Glycosyltransferase n=1 Tax=Pseudodonghicola flavimaris TaxID=3050036 RepID=A0ABT7F236_9RHOB|nr:glycosyltransferase [Pseudodonghicola flavimaris]MDK3018657.1 glycosyltransferase [Pseudodonghicola flavimaris]
MDRKVKTVGLVRFSVLTPTYYSERFKTLEETAAHIFAPERMELRFNLFEKLCLPSLVRQSDPEFDMVVLTAESMPPQYLERLLDLIEPLPNIHCLPVGTENHYKLLQKGYNAVSKEGYSHRILFRLDDDDAVDIDFVKRTKKIATAMLKLQGPKTPFVIAYNRGFYVRSTGETAEIFDACERAPLSTGTTLVAPSGSSYNPYRFNHRKLAQHFNTYSDISVPAFIRTIHGDNKSNPAQMGLTHKMGEAQIAKALKRHFDVTPEALRAL